MDTVLCGLLIQLLSDLLLDKNKSSAVVGKAIVQILSASIRPMILLSGNALNFMGNMYL